MANLPAFLTDSEINYAPSISVIIPTLNEAKNLPHVLPRIPAWVQEIIIVDGHSTDKTIEVARQLSDKVVIVHQTGRGKGNALIDGFKAATGDIIVMMDADGSTDPQEIPLFIAPLMSGWHFTKGSRYSQGGGTADISTFRSLGNNGLRFLVRTLFGGRYTDLCYGYSAFWRWTLDYIQPDVTGFEIETLINIRALRAKLKIAEVPSFEKPRIFGHSNLNAVRDGIRILKVILRERFAGQPVAVFGTVFYEPVPAPIFDPEIANSPAVPVIPAANPIDPHATPPTITRSMLMGASWTMLQARNSDGR